jgi:hypothetical protein
MSVIEPVNQVEQLCLELVEQLQTQAYTLEDAYVPVAQELFSDWADRCELAFYTRIIADSDEIADEVQNTLRMKALSRGYEMQLWFKHFPKKTVKRRVRNSTSTKSPSAKK